MSQQYQKQKKKWFNQGKLQAQKEELEFLDDKDFMRNMGAFATARIRGRIKQLQKEIRGMK